MVLINSLLGDLIRFLMKMEDHTRARSRKCCPAYPISIDRAKSSRREKHTCVRTLSERTVEHYYIYSALMHIIFHESWNQRSIEPQVAMQDSDACVKDYNINVFFWKGIWKGLGPWLFWWCINAPINHTFASQAGRWQSVGIAMNTKSCHMSIPMYTLPETAKNLNPVLIDKWIHHL